MMLGRGVAAAEVAKSGPCSRMSLSPDMVVAAQAAGEDREGGGV